MSPENIFNIRQSYQGRVIPNIIIVCRTLENAMKIRVAGKKYQSQRQNLI